MKRTLSILFAALLFTAAVYSQKSTTFGFKLGVASNYLTFGFGDDEKLVSSNTRPFLAGIAHIQFSDQFAIQPNLLVIMKGGSFGNSKINTTHIEVPVNLLYTHNGFFAGGGPNFSYGIVGKLDLGNEDVDVYNQEEAEELTLKKFDMGVNIILGYICPSGLTVSANFTPGLINVYKGAEDMEEDVTARSRTFAFTIGYLFGHKK